MLSKFLALPFQRNNLAGGSVMGDMGAIFAIDARNSVVGETAARNTGTGGAALNAVYSGTRFLPHTGTNYFYTPGSAGSNYASIPDSADLDIVGDIDLRWWGTMGNFVGGVEQTFVSKRGSVPNVSYTLARVSGSANLKLELSTDGTAVVAASTSTTFPSTPTVLKGFRATWRQSDGRVQFFHSDDFVSWTQIGIDQVIAIPSIFASSAVVEIGSSQSGALRPLAGSTYKVEIRNGIDGPKVLDVDFSLNTSQTSFVEGTGKTVTIIRSLTSGYKPCMVMRPTWLFDGADDVMVAPDDNSLDPGTSNSCTFVAIGRQWGTVISTRGWLWKGGTASPSARMMICNDAATNVLKFNVSDSTTPVVNLQNNSFTLGSLVTAIGISDRTAQLGKMYVNSDGPFAGGSDISLVGSSDNSNGLTVGAASGGNYNSFECYAAGYFNRALTDAEIDRILIEYDSYSPLRLGSTLKGWYDASDASSFTFSSGTLVSQWNDKSGNANHLTQATVGLQPSRSDIINGLPAVQFDGTDDSLSGAGLSTLLNGENDYTILGVLKVGSVGSNRSWYGTQPSSSSKGVAAIILGASTNWHARTWGTTDSASSQNSPTLVSNSLHLITAHFDSAGLLGSTRRTRARMDGVIISGQLPTAAQVGAASTYALGERSVGGGLNSNCSWAEKIICDRVLTYAEQQIIEKYLQKKWGTPTLS